MRIIRIQLRCNVVDLDFAYKQLLDGCKACKIALCLTQCQRQKVIGVASILYLTCQNCSTITMVKTSTWHLSENTQDPYAEMHGCLMLMLSVQRVCVRSSCYAGYRISFLFCVNWIDTEKTKNKMIIRKHSSSRDDNIKKKFVSVAIPRRKW